MSYGKKKNLIARQNVPTFFCNNPLIISRNDGIKKMELVSWVQALS